MNPWGVIIIALGIILIYIGVKGNPKNVAKGLQQAYGKVPGGPGQQSAKKPASGSSGVQVVL